jgi:hypothetical protein
LTPSLGTCQRAFLSRRTLQVKQAALLGKPIEQG